MEVEVYKTEDPAWYKYLVVTEFYIIGDNYIDLCVKLNLIYHKYFNYRLQMLNSMPIDLYENRYKKMKFL
jgi:hypothetical protein